MSTLLAKNAAVQKGDTLGTRTVMGHPFLAKVKEGARVRNRPHCVVRCSACGRTDVVVLHGTRIAGCTCGRAAALLAATTTHGQSGTPLYSVWQGIKHRCFNEKFAQFKDYGGRGVTMCQAWAADFAAFRDWALANGYAEGLEIDRRDNNGNYEPSNCRFVTKSVNCRNKRSNHALTAFGETKPLIAWAEDPRCVVGQRTLCSRIRYGWPVEVALTTKTRNALD